MPRSRQAAVVAGRIGGLTRAATAADPREITQQARTAAWQKYLDQVPAEITDPADRERRADLLRRAHMNRLSLKAATARKHARQARQSADQAAAEARAAGAVPLTGDAAGGAA